MPEQLTKSRAGGGDLFWRDWQAHQLACCCACPDTTEAENSKLRECAVRYFLVNKKLGFVFCALHSLEKLCMSNLLSKSSQGKYRKTYTWIKFFTKQSCNKFVLLLAYSYSFIYFPSKQYGDDTFEKFDDKLQPIYVNRCSFF